MIYTGVGKVNAASVATGAILAERPSLIVNYGTAGSVDRDVHGLREVARVIQRDMIAEPIAPRELYLYQRKTQPLSVAAKRLRQMLLDNTPQPGEK